MAGVADHRSSLGDEAMQKATGRHPDEWFALLDAENATSWTHTAIARWLYDVQGVDGWWAQGVTVRYEQARGMRLPGQQADGTFAVGSSKTIPLETAAALDHTVRAFGAALGLEPTSVRPEAKYPTARWKLPNGQSVLATVTRSTNGRSSVAMTWSRITDAAEVETAKSELARVLSGLAESLR